MPHKICVSLHKSNFIFFISRPVGYLFYTYVSSHFSILQTDLHSLTRVGGMRYTHTVLVGNLMGRCHFQDLDIDGRMMQKWISNKRISPTKLWLRYGPVTGSCQQGNERSGYIKARGYWWAEQLSAFKKKHDPWSYLARHSGTEVSSKFWLTFEV
jgi:hypothetical protein